MRFLPALARNDYLALLTCADVVLDPIHFGGGNSSYETLAVGTPLITLRGDFLRSRITSTIYEEMELTELIAENREEYCELAHRVANDATYAVNLRRRILDASGRAFGNATPAKQLEDMLLQLQPEQTSRDNQ